VTEGAEQKCSNRLRSLGERHELSPVWSAAELRQKTDPDCFKEVSDDLPELVCDGCEMWYTVCEKVNDSVYDFQQ